MTERCLSDFEGRWVLHKYIQQDDGAEAWFEGEARWRPVAQGLAYHEEGLLRIGAGMPVRAERRYEWRAPLQVYFEDGRFFHDVPPQGGQAHHDCAPDTYDVRYDFAGWPDWRAEWRVTGPRKAYRMRCDYRPLGQ